ncbi:uncharacterized protein PHACADRAFT_254332 [Phanerochaete carnosa HHB-10118-sp]|uniref:Uncharacterized protein n=1 Tax=Phanerochaete carnosa (strain HHB-10118-sp) TaxID=650164 RepID=K5VZD1_PHACS|nr:uncharacterized protein PHACADRAFT_254332 [Phanerochaete carnosa HHB-10118-sp]EKM56933.1 hypothetical protein PHACADRAFT_254332 [Phanerochaete carnosa HHB-10118-sp]
MLPYGLKIVWFALSLSGLLSSWVALPAFPRTVAKGTWIPVIYGVVDTVLQGVFCLGLIWKMDPFLMPRTFCIIQTGLMQLCWSCLAGCCIAMSLRSAADVFHDRAFGQVLQRMSGRLSRVVIIAVFPAAVFAVQLALLLSLNAVQPVDGLNCDASSPPWVRLVGYSGTSLLFAVPSVILSLVIVIHTLYPRHAQPMTISTARTVYSHDSLTSLPTRRLRHREPKYRPRVTDTFDYALSESPIDTHSALNLPKTLFPSNDSENPYPPLSPGRTLSQAKHSKYHLPFASPPVTPAQELSHPSSPQPSLQSARGSLFREVNRSRNSSYRSAPSPIIFSSPSRTENRPREPTVVNISPSPDPPTLEDEKDDGSITEVQHDVEGDNIATGSLRWAYDPEHASLKQSKDFGYDDLEEGGYDEPTFPPFPRIRRSPSGQPPWLNDVPDPAPPLLRVVCFQLFLAASLVVCAVTSLVDIFAHHDPPTPFGTQHAALVLVAWGPALFMGTVVLMNRIDWVSYPRSRPVLALCRR